MSETVEIFSISEILTAETLRRVGEIVSHLSSLLPAAHVEHVGSTAVPGCQGKGDIDIQVRVAAEEFDEARDVVDRLLERSTRNEATDGYVEYDYSRGSVAAAVHLVSAGGPHDVFDGFKTLLLTDPDVLGRYNALKQQWDGCPMEDYRRAKAAFIESALAAKRPGEE